MFEFFAPAGLVSDVRIIYDRTTGRSKGMAYVELRDRSAVGPALGLSGSTLKGVAVSVKASEAEKNLAWEADKAHKAAAAAAAGGGDGSGAAAAMSPGGTTAVPAGGVGGGAAGAGPSQLRVCGLAAGLSSDDVRAVFGPFGPLLAAQLAPHPPRPAGEADVVYASGADARAALAQLQGMQLAGLALRITPAPLSAALLAGVPPAVAAHLAIAAAAAAAGNGGGGGGGGGELSAAMAAQMAQLQMLQMQQAMGGGAGGGAAGLAGLGSLMGLGGMGGGADGLEDGGDGGVRMDARGRAALMARLAGGAAAGGVAAAAAAAAGLPGLSGAVLPPGLGGLGAAQQASLAALLMPQMVATPGGLVLMPAAGNLPGMPLPPPPPAPAPPAAPASAAAASSSAAAARGVQGVLGPASPIPTDCVLLKNMFSPAEETEAGWPEEIAADVSAECAKHGAVKHCWVDAASDGFVYLRFGSVDAAKAALVSMQGRWFAGRQVVAEYQFTARRGGSPSVFSFLFVRLLC